MANLNSIQRYLIIIRKIKMSNGISLQNLKQAVKEEMLMHGATNIAHADRTLKRDIADIRNRLHIPIDYSRISGYYIPSDEAYSEEYLETLPESFDILNVLNADTGMNHIVFPERQNYRGTEHLYPLLGAIRESRFVAFRYRKFKESRHTDRIIAPYALKECHGRWYLLGIQQGEQQLKTFGLDRLSLLRKLPEKYRRKEIPDLKEHYRDFFGIIAIDKLPTEEILISFKESEGKYVESLPIHASQQTVPHPSDSGRMMFRLRMKITRDLLLELLSRGSSMQVHAPDHLRQEICRLHREALEINSPQE